jgi:F-box associated protein
VHAHLHRLTDCLARSFHVTVKSYKDWWYNFFFHLTTETKSALTHHYLPPRATGINLDMSPFNKLPLELLLRTTNHLSTTDICSFRLTCRAIEISLFNSFAREFFTKKQFMLTYSSLQVLVEISKSRMGDCLQHVIIGLDHFVNAQHNLSAATDSERAKLGKVCVFCWTYYVDQPATSRAYLQIQ